MLRNIIIGTLLLIGVFLLFLFWNKFTMTNTNPNAVKIRYVALGDSYSNGEGAAPNDAWPVLLTQHLKEKGHDIELVANPSASGWTTQNLIDGELPTFKTFNPTFATLLIGANDSFQGVSIETFRKNFVFILDEMQQILPGKKKIILITIPDYSVTPQMRMYPNVHDVKKEIEAFNSIIKAEGEKRGLPVVDIFELTQAMEKDSGLVTADGLHPSAKELKLWEEKIFPVARAMLKK